MTSAPMDLPDSVDDALRTTLKDVLAQGATVKDAETGETFLELFAYRTGMRQPRRRVLVNSARRLNLIGAVGRFVWMLRGDNALAPITYYVPRAADYSPDGLRVPGSDYGARIRRPQPGVDQLVGVIQRLRQDPLSRQAATVVWNPLDAVRDPFDIPCAFGTLYHCRDGGVIGTTMMRSNKPSVMPINFFEFSMLAEIVAAELGLPLQRYVHFTGAVQIPERELEAAVADSQAEGESLEMATMPVDPGPLAQAQALAGIEERIRTSRDRDDLADVMAAAQEKLHPYWYAFAVVLSLQWYLWADLAEEALLKADELPDYFADAVRGSLKRRLDLR
ncbi:thymidylate synthase [Streptomyces albidoflavus]